MRKLLTLGVGVAALGLSVVALAGGGGEVLPEKGWYVGGQLGFGLTHWDNVNIPAMTPDLGFFNVLFGNITGIQVAKENGFAGRLHVGYYFNEHYSAEFGWTYLPSRVTVGGVGSIRNWAIDLSGKMYVPLPRVEQMPYLEQMGLFARLGINYLRSQARGHLTTTMGLPTWGGIDCHGRTSNWNVTYGVGAYYDYNYRTRFTLEWQRFHGKSRVFDPKYQPYMDAFTVGVSYRLPENLLVV